MRFTISALFIVTLVFALFLIPFSRPHPPEVSELLIQIERLPIDLENSDELEWASNYRPVAFDPRGKLTKFVAPIKNGYYIQTFVEMDPHKLKNTVVSAAIIKHVKPGTWKFIYPFYQDGEIIRGNGGEVGEPFEYIHLQKSTGATCYCPDCMADEN